MSERNDLELDEILAEFYREEQKPAPVQKPAAMTRRERAMAERAETAQTPPEEQLFASAQKAEEGTMVYTAKTARTGTRPATVQPKPRPTPQPRPAAPEPQKSAGQPKKAASGPVKKPRRGRGFALMLLVLALLASALFGLVRWTVRAEQAAEPAQPEALRLELGADLEKALDESASSSR